MSKLILDLPDKQVAWLERVAQRRGMSIQALVAELIDDVAAENEPEEEYTIQDDPLFNIQAHESQAPADLSQKSGGG